MELSGYLVTMSGSFHPFCKVLFILRSHYLYAIGLRVIFSLGRGIPANFALRSQSVLLDLRMPSQSVSDSYGGLALFVTVTANEFAAEPLCKYAPLSLQFG
jgi:hypothetical protein